MMGEAFGPHLSPKLPSMETSFIQSKYPFPLGEPFSSLKKAGLPEPSLSALNSFMALSSNKDNILSVGGPSNSKVITSIRDVSPAYPPTELRSEIEPFLQKKVEEKISRKLFPCSSYGYFVYPEGRGHYDWHCDDGHILPNGKFNYDYPCRKITMIYYPNDNYLGGEISIGYRQDSIFKESIHKFKPQKDYLLIFPSDQRFLHKVDKVTSGERFAVVCWFDYLE